MKPYVKRRARRPPATISAVAGGRHQSPNQSPSLFSSARLGPTPPIRNRDRLNPSRFRRLSALSAWMSRSDAGAVTAEFASVLPSVMVMIVLLAALARGVVVSMTCQDAASAAARAVVSSGGDADSEAAAQAVVGKGVDVDIDVDAEAGTVTVITRCPVVPDPMGVLPSLASGKAVGVLT
ncbi:TadE/TadG family type IV pilus assembly protein [Bifidobacterium callitrichos]|uniref:TadE/TadG family type IV pilus assembly protein n=1 Tax=Bifidobacterium callitrichos TaxID=762209 RepID=UPI003F6D502B